MLRPSSISPDILLNESLGMTELSGSLMCVNGMKLLKYAHDNDGITLTKSGGFFRKFVTWAADEFQWPGQEPEKLYAMNKVLNEQDFFPLAVMHDLMLVTRLLRHVKGKAVPTKAGRAIMGDHGALQAVLFDAYFMALDPSAFDRFVIEYKDADLRHFIGVVQNRLGDWVTLVDFASWCLPIEAIQTYRISPQYDACFYLMSKVVRPLLWLGLLERKPEQDTTRIEERLYRKTPLFDRFIRIMMGQSGGRAIH
jgi:hypothetical protein